MPPPDGECNTMGPPTEIGRSNNGKESLSCSPTPATPMCSLNYRSGRDAVMIRICQETPRKFLSVLWAAFQGTLSTFPHPLGQTLWGCLAPVSSSAFEKQRKLRGPPRAKLCRSWWSLFPQHSSWGHLDLFSGTQICSYKPQIVSTWGLHLEIPGRADLEWAASAHTVLGRTACCSQPQPCKHFQVFLAWPEEGGWWQLYSHQPLKDVLPPPPLPHRTPPGSP